MKERGRGRGRSGRGLRCGKQFDRTLTRELTTARPSSVSAKMDLDGAAAVTVFPTDLDQLLLLFLFACFLRSGLCCSGRSVYLSHRNVYSPTSSQTWRTGHTGSTRVFMFAGVYSPPWKQRELSLRVTRTRSLRCKATLPVFRTRCPLVPAAFRSFANLTRQAARFQNLPHLFHTFIWD